MSDGAVENHEQDVHVGSSVAETQTSNVADISNVDDSTANDSDTVGNSSDSSIATGLSSLISFVIRDFDCRAEATVRSQDHLTVALDRLTRELDQLLEDAPLPFIMQHAAKISGVRKRVTSLNSVLKSIQQRVDKIDQMVSTGLMHEKKSAGQS